MLLFGTNGERLLETMFPQCFLVCGGLNESAHKKRKEMGENYFTHALEVNDYKTQLVSILYLLVNSVAAIALHH